MQLTLDLVVIIQLITVLVVVAGFIWRLPSKSDIQRLDDRIDTLETELGQRIDKVETTLGQRIDKVDAKVDDTRESLLAENGELRKEVKTDMQRLEDKLGAANQYHARSVELLDAIRKELEERRQPL